MDGPTGLWGRTEKDAFDSQGFAVGLKPAERIQTQARARNSEQSGNAGPCFPANPSIRPQAHRGAQVTRGTQ